MADTSRVGAKHFELLTLFGRDKIAQESDDETRRHLWKMMCRGANLPDLPHEQVVAAWQEFISGDSVESGIVANGDIDPRFTTIGITWKKKITATHTILTDALLFKLLTIYSKAFERPSEFEGAVLHIARKAIERSRERK